MDKRPQLVFMTSRFPFPLDKGDKLRAYHLIKHLSANFRIHLISLTDEDVPESNQDELDKYTESRHIFRLGRSGIVFRLLLNLFHKRPFQLAYFTNYFVKKNIENLLHKIQPDHIFCQLLRSAEYVKNYHHCHKTLDYMDALSKGMDRRINKSTWWSRWIVKIEAQRLRDYERRIYNYFEYHTMISQQDTLYIAHPDQSKISVIPNGIDGNYFQNQGASTAEYDLVFVGNLSYVPNVDALEWLGKNILSKHPEWTLLVAGAIPNKKVLDLHHHYPNITVEGWQDDIRNAYNRGKIFIAPMQIGTGLQNKLLEAMAMEKPCVTTSLVNDALLATPDKHLFIANDAATMEKQIVYLLENPEVGKKIGTEAREFVLSRYSWERSSDLLSSLFIHLD